MAKIIAMLKPTLIIFCALSLQAFALRDKDGQSLHGQIMRESLSNKVCQRNLDFMTFACDQTTPEVGQNFFEKGRLKSSLAYVEKEQKIILNYAGQADINARTRYRTLVHLGKLMRACQDFYGQSNYLDLQSEKLKARLGPSFDPYQIDLVDWGKLTDPAYLRTAKASLDEGGKLKESEESGREKLGQGTYFKAAKDLATRETIRQWDMMLALIRNRYPKRSASIITALREVPAEVAKDDDPGDLD